MWWIAGASIAGCATAPNDPWADIEIPPPGAARPVDCGGFPIPDEIGTDSIIYDRDGVEALEIYRVCADGNWEIANAHADQVDAQRIQADALVDAGRHQKRIADMRQEILEEERRHMLWERLGYWAALLALAAAL